MKFHDTGNGVRTVGCGSTTRQNLDTFDQCRRNLVKVSTEAALQCANPTTGAEPFISTRVRTESRPRRSTVAVFVDPLACVEVCPA